MDSKERVFSRDMASYDSDSDTSHRNHHQDVNQSNGFILPDIISEDNCRKQKLTSSLTKRVESVVVNQKIDEDSGRAFSKSLGPRVSGQTFQDNALNKDVTPLVRSEFTSSQTPGYLEMSNDFGVLFSKGDFPKSQGLFDFEADNDEQEVNAESHQESNVKEPFSSSPFITRKSPGLKMSIPSVTSRYASLIAYFNPKSSKGTDGKAKSHAHTKFVVSDYESSINDGFFSGRRSAPVFSRRHYSGGWESYRNLKKTGISSSRRVSKWMRKKDKTENVRRSNSSGAIDEDLIDYHDYLSDGVEFSPHYSSDEWGDRGLHQAPIGNLNRISSQGYWSECDADSTNLVSPHQDNTSHHLQPYRNQPHRRLLPPAYRPKWRLPHGDIVEHATFNTVVPRQARHPSYLGPVPHGKTNPPETDSCGSEDERVLLTRQGISPRLEYGTYGIKPKTPHQFEGGEKDGDRVNEKTPLLKPAKSVDSHDSSCEVKTDIYKRRWYILLLFSLYCLIWNAVWSTWGPIARSAKAVYDWNDANIAMFTWLGNVPFIVTMFPVAYLMDVKGMRVAMVFTTGLSLLGAGLRCITTEPDTATWFINVGQLLNGIAGTVPVSGAALVSGLWFPPNQRATATGISTIMGYLGVCVSFVTGPLLVPEPESSAFVNTSTTNLRAPDSLNSSNVTDLSQQQDGITNLLYYEFGAMGIVFFLAVLYFPSRPPLPPSVSASMPREGYVKGLKMLIRNKQFWLTAMACSIPVGVYEVWQIVLDVNLENKVSQETAGWMDFYATLGGCAAGLLVSRFADLFSRQMRLFLIVFYTLSCVSALWFTLLAMDILPFDMVSIYAATVICGLSLDGAAPLFFELVIEVSYPVGEGVTSGFLQMLCAWFGIVFLSIMQIESIGKSWMNWCLFGSIAVAIPLLLFVRTPLGRADIDDSSCSENETGTDIDTSQDTIETKMDKVEQV